MKTTQKLWQGYKECDRWRVELANDAIRSAYPSARIYQTVDANGVTTVACEGSPSREAEVAWRVVADMARAPGMVRRNAMLNAFGDLFEATYGI